MRAEGIKIASNCNQGPTDKFLSKYFVAKIKNDIFYPKLIAKHKPSG